MKKVITGFTIVELLIVIVVIAILATISVVAYGNITKRAHSAKVDSEVSALSKRLQLDFINSDTYPDNDSLLKPALQSAGVWDSTRTVAWTYLYCTDEASFALLPWNSAIDVHSTEESITGEIWRVYRPHEGWDIVEYDPNAYPGDTTRARDLCASALPSFTWQRWFSAIP